MGIIDEVSDRGMALPVGIGLALAAVSMGPKLVKAGRPMIKSAMKGYLIVSERAQEMFAETGERLQDVYAEVKHEYEQETTCRSAEEDSAAEPASEPSKAAKTAEGARPARPRQARKPKGEGK